MSYNVIDLLDKAINIAIKRKTKYEEISESKSNIPSFEIISKVLTKEIEKTIQYYKTLKKELEDTELEEIEFVTYDKISYLINEYNKKIYITEIQNPREFFKFSLGLEKDVYSLFIDIQGRLVKNTNDLNTKTYKILSELINHKAKIIVKLEDFLK